MMNVIWEMLTGPTFPPIRFTISQKDGRASIYGPHGPDPIIIPDGFNVEFEVAAEGAATRIRIIRS